MYQLLYTSTAAIGLAKSEMEAFLGPSRQKNAAAGVTGLLVHVCDEDAGKASFLQHLEGPREAVEQTYERIVGDEMHSDVEVLHRGESAGRMFGDWSMRLILLDAASVPDLARTGRPIDPYRPIDPDAPAPVIHDADVARALIRSFAATSCN